MHNACGASMAINKLDVFVEDFRSPISSQASNFFVAPHCLILTNRLEKINLSTENRDLLCVALVCITMSLGHKDNK